MRIGEGFDYSQVYNDLSSIKLRDTLSEVTPVREDSPKAVDNTGAGRISLEEQVAASPGKLIGLEDISVSFNKNDDFDLIGTTSDITNLDVAKVVSLSKRDDILSSYRSSETQVPVYAGEEGTVIAK
ncbi:MAG: hypothetical protein J6X94_09690 [Lachnospiraceae bacterium]|nr:hypothetical protein [Lachnospiraceae bacterium]